MPTSVMTDNEVREWIEYACDSCGRPDINNRIDILWSSRMTRSIGMAGGKRGEFHIKLSTKLFARATHEEQYETVIHEVCHILNYFINGRANGHDACWVDIMDKCGIKPEVYHCVDTSGLTRKFIYACPNDCHDFKLSTRKHNASQRGRGRICDTCKCRLSWTGKVEEPDHEECD